MTFIEKLKMIERIDQLIRMKATGNAKDLAGRLGVSRRTVFDVLEIMKNLNAPILFNNVIQSYVYQYEGSFNVSFSSPEKIKGGKNIECSFFALPQFIFESR